MWLVFGSFWLSILGTFLTRSGIISSVHAFAQSSIGTWFAWFLAIIFVVFLFFFVKNKDHLRSEHKLESLVSRESSFLFNNLLFLLLCFDVLWGTWFPKISELVQGNKVTVGAPFYNRVAIPVALFLILLTALGPLLAWRKTSFESLKRNFMWPSFGAVAVAVFLMVTPQSWGSPFGLRPWQDISYLYSLMAISLSVLVTLTVGERVLPRRQSHLRTHRSGHVRLHGATDAPQHPPLRRLRRPLRRCGRCDRHSPAPPSIRTKNRRWASATKWRSAPTRSSASPSRKTTSQTTFSEWAIFDVYKDGKKIDTMTPVRDSIKASQQASTKPDIRSTFKGDLYVVYEGQNEKSQPIIKAHLNPLVMWIWLGVWIMLAGTILCLVPNAPAPVRVPAPKLVGHEAAVATGD